MTIKDLIKAEVDKVEEERLDELYRVVQKYSRDETSESTLMDRLMQIQIDGPEDFAANFDLYASGEKRV
jgi:hypothetical protein